MREFLCALLVSQSDIVDAELWSSAIRPHGFPVNLNLKLTMGISGTISQIFNLNSSYRVDLVTVASTPFHQIWRH